MSRPPGSRERIASVREEMQKAVENGAGIYRNGGAQSMLTVTRDGHGGYIGTITLGVRRS